MKLSHSMLELKKKMHIEFSVFAFNLQLVCRQFHLTLQLRLHGKSLGIPKGFVKICVNHCCTFSKFVLKLECNKM